MKQEYIPVGCVPAARRPYAGVCFRGGGAWSGGVVVVSGLGGWCLVGVVVSGPGGWVSAPGGVGIPGCTEADTPPPLWTDRRL